MDLDDEQLAAAAAAFEASDDDVAPESLGDATVDLRAVIQDREATVLRAMEEDPIDHAELESAIASAGRFRLELSPTLDAANGRLIEWRKTSLRNMWEFADLAYFFRCFHTDELLESLPKCDTSDLERLLLDTSSNGLAGTLHIALMKLVWPRLPAREDNWFRLLLKNFSGTEGLVEGSWSGALQTMLINEEEDGKIATDLPPNHSNQTIQNKTMLLHTLVHLVFDIKHPGVMAVIQENQDSWRMQPACWYEDDATKVRHEFYYFTDIEVGCLLGEHWQVEVSDTGVDTLTILHEEDNIGEVEAPLDDEEETFDDDAGVSHESEVSPEVLPKKRKGRSSSKRGKKKSVFARPDSDSDTDEEVSVKDEPTVATVSLGGRVRKQTQHFQPPPAPKSKKTRKKSGTRESGKGARGGRGGGKGKGKAGGKAGGGQGHTKGRAAAARKSTTGGKAKSTGKKLAKPSKPLPKMESRWKTHAIGLDELEALLYSEGLDHDVATMIREVWLPEGQQKMKQRQRQSRRVNAQLKALSFGDSGGFGDPLGVQEESTGGRRRRTAVNYSEAAYDQQINEAIRESNREYRRGGAPPTTSPQEPARKRGVRTTRQGRGIGDEIQEVVDKILSSSSSGSDRSEVLGHVLASLQKKDPDNIFANPVDTTLVFDYLDVVAEPMDFKTMSSKIKSRSYHSCTAFEHDLALVVSNCRAYNEPESIYCTAAAELETWGAKLFAHLRNTDMLPPDDPTYSSDEDESSSTDSSDDNDEGGSGMDAANSFVAPSNAAMSAGRAPANAAGWRQSATAFLHDQQSQISAPAGQASGRADITAELHGGNSSSSTRFVLRLP